MPHRGTPSPIQNSLLGFEETPASDSLFFCVFPDAIACEAIIGEADALRAEHALIGQPHHQAKLHVTLHHLGTHAGLRQEIVDAATQAASHVVLPAFQINLSQASSFGGGPGKHPCVLLCPEERPPLHALWRELGTQLMAAGLGRHVERKFTPHVTLMYSPHLLPTQSIANIGWKVRDFSLVHSLQRRGEYRVLGSWPLQ